MVPAATDTTEPRPHKTDTTQMPRTEDVLAEPPGVDELANLVASCAEEGRAVFPAGGASAWTYGGIPSRPGVRLETKQLDNVIDYPVDDMTITVESGMTLGRLQSILAENNQYLPIDPPNAGTATLGGIMATGWTGPRRQHTLKPRDQVIGISFVDGLGRVIRGGGRVVKNVAGYDFPKLLTGSMGALGIITELTFKVRPRPESTAIAWIGLPDILSLASLLEKLNLSETRPTVIEILDRTRAEAIGKPAGLEASSWVAAIGFDESAKAVAWQCDKIREEVPKSSTCEMLRDEASEPVWSALTEGFVSTDDSRPVARVVTRPGRAAELLDRIDTALWSVQAHGGQGIVSLQALEPIEKETALAAFAEWQEQVEPWGGSVVWPVCPEAWKADFPVWGKHRPERDLMAGIKRALDPKGILNPGRFLGLS